MAEFIPKKYLKEPITIRIDSEKLKIIDKLADKFEMSRSKFINQCIDYSIDNIKDVCKK